MSTIAKRLATVERKVVSNLALYNGTRDKGALFAMFGNTTKYGCKITQGFGADNFYLGLDGTVDHINANSSPTPTEKHEYSNTSTTYGEVFLSVDKNVSTLTDEALKVEDPPSVGYARYDIVYLYVDYNSPKVLIATGTSSVECYDDKIANGINSGNNGESIYDPAIPTETYPIARVYVQGGDIGISDANIVDIRKFSTSNAPILATSDGEKGEIAIDANYAYFCVDANTWKRVAISTW